MSASRAVLEQTSNGTAAVTERVAAVVANPAAPLEPRTRGSLERRISLVFGGALAGWLLLAFSFAGRLDLAPATLIAAAVILALLAATLLYAVRLGARVDRTRGADVVDNYEVRRGVEHLHFVSALCQLLGLIGTVVGFLLVLTGGFATVDAADQSSVQHLLSRVAEGSATALVSTFTGVVASVLISLAAHLLAPAAE